VDSGIVIIYSIGRIVIKNVAGLTARQFTAWCWYTSHWCHLLLANVWCFAASFGL